MTDHAERRADALEAVKLMRAAGWNKAADSVMDEVNELYPPSEPERVWVKLEATGTEYSRSADGTWVSQDIGNTRAERIYPAIIRDEWLKDMASLVPGPVAQPVEPTAWLNVHGDALNLYPDLPTARTRACGGCRIIPIVELPEVPRDA